MSFLNFIIVNNILHVLTPNYIALAYCLTQGASNKPKNYYFSSFCRQQEVIRDLQTDKNFQMFFNIISLKCLKCVEK